MEPATAETRPNCMNRILSVVVIVCLSLGCSDAEEVERETARLSALLDADLEGAGETAAFDAPWEAGAAALERGLALLDDGVADAEVRGGVESLRACLREPPDARTLVRDGGRELQRALRDRLTGRKAPAPADPDSPYGKFHTWLASDEPEPADLVAEWVDTRRRYADADSRIEAGTVPVAQAVREALVDGRAARDDSHERAFRDRARAEVGRLRGVERLRGKLEALAMLLSVELHRRETGTRPADLEAIRPAEVRPAPEGSRWTIRRGRGEGVVVLLVSDHTEEVLLRVD